MATWGLSESEVRYLQSLAARFGLLVRTDAARRDTWWSRRIHGRQARAAGLGTWGEGLAGLHRASLADSRLAPLRPAIEERLTCAAGMLRDRQIDTAEAAVAPDRRRAEGAWFTDGVTRMDDQQHALSALLLASLILSGKDQP
jgi:hypothetical protein